MTKTIRQTVTLPAPPRAVFEALVDSRQHSSFTGDTAKLSRRVGGRFSVFGGWARGRNLRVEAGRLLEQTWRTADFREDEADSTVTFHLSRKGEGTQLRFVQVEVPDRLADDLRQGWKDFYWTPLKAYLHGAME